MSTGSNSGGALWDRVWNTYRQEAAPSDYLHEPFRLVEKRYAPRFLAQAESLFAMSNGFLGVRGAFEEENPCHQRATLVNGFHETWPIVYGEEAYGFAKTGQTIVPVPDATLMKLYVDDEPLDMDRSFIHEARRVLDMRTGLLSRQVVWETPDGRRLAVRSRRCASLEHRHLFVIDYEVELLDSVATLTISSELARARTYADEGPLDPRRARPFDLSVLEPVSYEQGDGRVVLSLRTQSSGMTVACGVEHSMTTECEFEQRLEGGGDQAREVFLVDGRRGCPVRLTKFAAYHASANTGHEELEFRVHQSLDRALHVGVERIFERQHERMAEFWTGADVRIEGAPELQSAVRFNLFHVFQSAARADGLGLPSKGLTGTGYEGQYFWDADIFVVPLCAYSIPHVAKNLINFRAGMLDKARERAREVGHRGALYPWRTINGEEASAYYAAGTAQYHINADIVSAISRYTRAAGDLEFLADKGVEIMVETARLWVDLGFFSSRKGGEFVINGVTGPDEYTTVVDNNLYTNLMARENLLVALDAVEWLRVRRPDKYEVLAGRTGLDLAELAVWRRAAENIHVPYDDEAQVHLQDDAFLDREVWDFANTPAEKYPLLLHYHPLEIYRHQVIKQADVVLATFLLGYWFTYEDKKRIFDYYDPLTTGDSSLSASIQAIMATELGLMESATRYFARAVLIDLLDLAGNVRDGLHIASAGGVWLALVCGFGGLRDHDGELRFQPVIPEGWERMTFRIRRRSQLIEVSVCHEDVSYTLLEGRWAVVHHWGTEVTLTEGETVVLPDPRREELPRLPGVAEEHGLLEREPWRSEPDEPAPPLEPAHGTSAATSSRPAQAASPELT
ncbi:MAG: Alpha,alpha-trehalose phosphorylase [Acidimicrobiales bacterium]|nr:MAG: glycoside hydrolase family 65 protein [Actinomycetota bacterium]MBV6509739.1 Alpha,alpha-trehalose phosphorylase [Acidimicrobiales bacterium]RIK04867.1 MAG: family 65 glycosyl hydrolase [Acidobacteriota bacterium]